MYKLLFFRVPFALTMFLVFTTSLLHAQQWNPNHKIGTVTGKYHFSPGQTPDQVVEIFPAAIPNTGLTYKWYSSPYPTTAFVLISGATASSYTLPAASFTQTTYLKRVSTYTASGQTFESNVVKINLVSVGWEDLNYVRVHDVKVTDITNWQSVDLLAIGSKRQTTDYLDGLGRNVQSLSKGEATPTTVGGQWGDLVKFQVYDEFGREARKYIPYPSYTEIGKFKSSTTVEQAQFISSKYNESSPFAQTQFDLSPLSRLVNLKKPGFSWAVSSGNQVSYDLNISSEHIPIYQIGYASADVPNNIGEYASNTLIKNVMTDEAGKQIVEFYDDENQLILKKVQVDNLPASNYSGWACSLSIYDEFGRLRIQVQPEGVKYLEANSWLFSGVEGGKILAEQCFQYLYDAKGRLTWKKAPGAAPLNLVYDSRDRLAFTQDGVQSSPSSHQWTVTLYDELDRIAAKALYNTTKSLSTLTSEVNSAAQISTLTVSNTANTGGGTSITMGTSLSSVTAAELNNSSTMIVLLYQFYDNYTFNSSVPFSANFNNLLAYNPSDINVQTIGSSIRVNNFGTGNKVRVLGTNNFLTLTQYFDEKGRIVQKIESNIKSGMDVTTYQYHFDGRLLSNCKDHSTAGLGYTNFKILSKYTYDQIQRLASLDTKIGDNGFKSLYTIEYDETGRQKKRRVAPGYTGGGNADLESLEYAYTMTNQLSGINKDYALKTPGIYNKWEHFFGMYLGYDNRDNAFTNSNLLDQITGQLWTTQGDDAQRRMDYKYDNVGRLALANFGEKKVVGDSWSKLRTDFSVGGSTGDIIYDLNGNLLSMKTFGVLPGSSTPIPIDVLAYSYQDHSNKLLKVLDNMSTPSFNGASTDFKDGSNTTGNDYVYDNNGNLVVDLNKEMRDLSGQPNTDGIKYNYLDKPEFIRILGKGTLQVVYSALGEKLQRIFTPEASGSAVTTSYVGSFVYKETAGAGIATLQYINLENSRLRVVNPINQVGPLDGLVINGNIDLPNGQRGAFDYFILDYLQNVRMILTEEVASAQNSCTLETAAGRNSIEEPIFGQTGAANEVSSTRWTKPSNWTGNTTSFVSRLGSSFSHNVGPNTLQKVMAGDQVSSTARYYFEAASGGNSASFVSTVISTLVQAITGSNATSLVIKSNASQIATQLSGLSQFGNAVQPNGTNPTGTSPQAFLTILFFDERFNFIEAANGGVAQLQVDPSVTSAGKSFNSLAVKAPKSGYVYVYLSNQSNNAVYFDDFKVSINSGNILEESHYYPYGLKMAGISSRKLSNINEGHTSNNYQNQGAFSEIDGDLGWNDFILRQYDPQIGRWIQHDPFDLFFESPYVGMGSDPINSVDPTGGIYIPPVVTLSEVVIYSSKHIVTTAATFTRALGVSVLLNSAMVANAAVNIRMSTLQVGLQVEDPKRPKSATDAGHGNNGDPGAVSGTSYEKDYALKVEERTNFFLQMFGIDNVRTRTGDTKNKDGFKFRYQAANDHGAEVFVSFHLNGGTTDENVYIVYQQGKGNEAASKEFANTMAASLRNIMTVPANGVATVKQRTRFNSLAVLNGFNGKAGILIEFGSIQSEATRGLIDQQSAIMGYWVAAGIYKYLTGKDTFPLGMMF